MFSQACVILFTGGVSASVHAGIQHPPLEQTPPGAAPPGADPPPATNHAGRYSQRADGTHPTGMQSCLLTSFHFDSIYYDDT